MIAAEHFNRLAHARGLALRAESLGVEPDAEVPPPVVAGLAVDGVDVRGYAPRKLTADGVACARHIVSFGCDLDATFSRRVRVERWDDLPMVSDGFQAARDAIVARVERLLGAIG